MNANPLKTLLFVAVASSVVACGDDGGSNNEYVDSGADVGIDAAGDAFTGGTPGLSAAEIDDDTMFVVASYRIDGDELLPNLDGPPSQDSAETFALYTGLIPATYREGVIAFVAIDQEQSGGTDGALQDVYGADGEPTGDRYIALDVTGSSTEMERTIVHETGHLIFVEPGTSEPTSYAVDFNEAFPPGAEYNPNDFVTEYAASVEDGGEDIAESWAMYVFEGTDFAGDADDDGELDEVPADTLAAEKVEFFADYPELVQLREDILTNAFP